MFDFEAPCYEPHRWYRGGHLQTLASVRSSKVVSPTSTKHEVTLPDGDAIVLHETPAVDGAASGLASPSPETGKSLLLIHGLSGCHGSPYMIRMARQFSQLGYNVFRVDMRGCGAAEGLARELNHAGRSDDIATAFDFVAQLHPDDQLFAAGISLGGNQLLRLAGRIGAGEQARPSWIERVNRIAVVAPPIDLIRCSENMQRFSRRPYNYYFVRNLFDRIPPRVKLREDFALIAGMPRPRTLFELDERLTAPLSGFSGAPEYYRLSGAGSVAAANPFRTLVLAAKDDPIVPVDCFQRPDWPRNTTVKLTETGGHTGFITRDGACYMDQCIVAWMNHL